MKRYIKFLGVFTAVQLLLFAITSAYYLYEGLPQLYPSSPAYLYWWPLNHGNWGHASPFIFLVGPFMLIVYSIVATIGYVLVSTVRWIFTQKY